MEKLKKLLLLVIGISSIIAFAFFSIFFTEKPAKILAGQQRLNGSLGYTMFLKVAKADSITPIVHVYDSIYVYLWDLNNNHNAPFPGVLTKVSIIDENKEFVIGTIPVNTAEYNFMILTGRSFTGKQSQTNDIVFSSFDNDQNGVFIQSYSVQQNKLSATPFSYLNDYSQGYDDGYYEGKNDGIEEGYQEGYQEGYLEGEENGFNDGYQEGFQQGKAENDSYGIAPFVQTIFNGFSTMLNVEIFPKIKLWYIIGIPLIFGIVKFIIGWIK